MKKSLIILAGLALAIGVAAIAQAAGVPVIEHLQAHAGGIGLAGAAGITSFWQKGDVLDLKPAADVNSGVGYLFGASLFGVAATNVTANTTGSFIVEGVVTIAKTSALAISTGDRVFWDPVNKCVNKTAAAQQSVGIAVEDAANPSPTVKILLDVVTPVGT